MYVIRPSERKAAIACRCNSFKNYHWLAIVAVRLREKIASSYRVELRCKASFAVLRRRVGWSKISQGVRAAQRSFFEITELLLMNPRHSSAGGCACPTGNLLQAPIRRYGSETSACRTTGVGYNPRSQQLMTTCRPRKSTSFSSAVAKYRWAPNLRLVSARQRLPPIQNDKPTSLSASIRE